MTDDRVRLTVRCRIVVMHEGRISTLLFYPLTLLTVLLRLTNKLNVFHYHRCQLKLFSLSPLYLQQMNSSHDKRSIEQMATITVGSDEQDLSF